MFHTMTRAIKTTRLTLSDSDGTSNVALQFAAGQNAKYSVALDMLGFVGARFLALIGTLTNAAVMTVKLQQNDIATCTDSGWADITGVTKTVTDAGAGASASQVIVLETYKPTKRYVRAVWTRATQNSVIDGLIADQYRAFNEPVTQGANIATPVAGAPTV